jgi:hypothetical protein
LYFLYETEFNKCFELQLFRYFDPLQYSRKYYENRTIDTEIKQLISENIVIPNYYGYNSYDELINHLGNPIKEFTSSYTWILS